MNIDASQPWPPTDALAAPRSRLVGAKPVVFGAVGSCHDPSVRGREEQFRPCARPGGIDTTTGRDLPWSAISRKGANVYFVTTGFVGLVCDPTTVWREHRLSLVKGTVEKDPWLSWFEAGPHGFIEWQDPNIKVRSCCTLLVRQKPSRRMPRIRILGVAARCKRLDVTGSIRSLPIETERHGGGASRGERDVPAVWCPHGLGVVRWIERQA